MWDFNATYNSVNTAQVFRLFSSISDQKGTLAKVPFQQSCMKLNFKNIVSDWLPSELPNHSFKASWTKITASPWENNHLNGWKSAHIILPYAVLCRAELSMHFSLNILVLKHSRCFGRLHLYTPSSSKRLQTQRGHLCMHRFPLLALKMNITRNTQNLSATCFTCSPLDVCGHLSLCSQTEGCECLMVCVGCGDEQPYTSTSLTCQRGETISR